MIFTDEITKRYGDNEVLRGISLCAETNQITLLVGPNGAGKSTSMKIFAGLIRPNAGRAFIDEIDIVAQRIAAQRLLSYLPQNPSFHPKLTCPEILKFYGGLRGVPVSRCAAMLELTGLSDVARMHRKTFRRHAAAARFGVAAFTRCAGLVAR